MDYQNNQSYGIVALIICAITCIIGYRLNLSSNKPSQKDQLGEDKRSPEKIQQDLSSGRERQKELDRKRKEDYDRIAKASEDRFKKADDARKQKENARQAQYAQVVKSSHDVFKTVEEKQKLR